MVYELIFKRAFQNQLRALPRKQRMLVQEKIDLLCDDPTPDGHLKEKVHQFKCQETIFRLRCGDYRVLYTYGAGWVKLLIVELRKDVYRGDHLVLDETALPDEALADVDLTPKETPPVFPIYLVDTPLSDDDLLPVPIDEALLTGLGIPQEYFPGLMACRTLEDLTKAQTPSEEARTAIFDCVTNPDLPRVMQQPDYVIPTDDGLLRFKEGELVAFLLKLSPDQEKYVYWGMNAAGPALVKGGPGSGKSTVALYRVRELLRALRQAGTEQPRILFTTYTNALVNVSRQLLQTLLGEDICWVEVRTADSLAYNIATGNGSASRMANTAELRQALREAQRHVSFQGNLLQRQTQGKIIDTLGQDYLIEELTQVIEARQLTTLEAYLAAPRPGRRMPLNELQRTAIWRLHETFLVALEQLGCQTWQMMRARAEEMVRSGQGPESYDAVLIDEAQDLDPSLLRMLAGLCRSPNRLFVTADANQSIYGSGFRWSDVHESLQFRGRTGILRANYRSTKEIGEAARAYLGEARLDAELSEVEYINNGGIQPAMRAVRSKNEEIDLLARFLPKAARHLLLGLGACVILCPTERSCQAIVDGLTAHGLEAIYMTGKDLDLGWRGIKVMTLKSSKGLEFPIVALAGFLDSPYPLLRSNITDEEREEALAQERRILFVAMTRAMRALLVVVPAEMTSPLLRNFDSIYWNIV